MALTNPVPSPSADRNMVAALSRLKHREDDDRELSEPAFSQTAADEMLAHIIWSRLVEPGDSVAGVLVQSVGARQALSLMLSAAKPRHIAQLLRSEHQEVSERKIGEALKRWLPRFSQADTTTDIQRAVAAGLVTVTPRDELWPTQLNDLEYHRPMMLWVRGNVGALTARSIAVVGARMSSSYGEHVTAEIGSAIAGAGVSIVSGAAYGIDAVAHRTALAMHTPTIAVLAGGADRPYPSAHEQMLLRISDTGAVCSEMVPSSAPTKWRFLQRNRLIAALSQATLVTEAGMRSGSINTAHHASQLGRPVGAVPGPITSNRSSGCNLLIKDHTAEMITTAADALAMIQLNHSSEQDSLLFENLQDRETSWHTRVRDAMPLKGARELAAIARAAGLTNDEARGVLAELELLAQVKQVEHADGSPRWSLMAK